MQGNKYRTAKNCVHIEEYIAKHFWIDLLNE